MSDGELIDRVMTRLPRTDVDSIDVDRISPRERNVVMILTLAGIVGNGGFQYFFENDFVGLPSYRLFAEAYREVGADDCAVGFEEVLALFPSEQPIPERRQREAYVDSLLQEGTRTRATIDRVENLFGDTEIRNERLVAEYIRENAETFSIAR